MAFSSDQDLDSPTEEFPHVGKASIERMPRDPVESRMTSKKFTEAHFKSFPMLSSSSSIG
ncbi:hypothetical protein LTR56_012368 [Elasticomyces elasticus]|nr:hypothetical protein LTR56_012368 [Elasticomyces elasticus]KAK3652328.1 hypothetical protein LTR22_011682 [Elasticomyces elasticus]KAK4918986.1 hypothetical protein LTR49_013303 [Elasticomyces elasticus]KAK5756663.1 hypothetical protein LTS12_013253 [Elasticomyces elasticus]